MAAPRDSAPRLYVETLNEMINMQTVRVAAINNRIPGTVLLLEVLGAAIAFGLLALYTAMLGRGATTVVLAGGLATLLLLVMFDLDRPTRGLIRSPIHRSSNYAHRWRCPPLRAGRRDAAADGRDNDARAQDRPRQRGELEDLQTVLGTRGDPSRCQCQRYKMQPRESWASVGREELAFRLRTQTEVVSPRRTRRAVSSPTSTARPSAGARLSRATPTRVCC